MLIQKHGHQKKVVAHASYVLTKAEMIWSIYDRELWSMAAVVQSVETWLGKWRVAV